MANPLTTASANDRLLYTLFLAVALHALLALGLNFAPEPPKKPLASLEITLAQRPSERAPEEADYLADHNQQGSGSEREKKKTTTDQQPLLSDSRLRELTPLPQAEIKPQQSNQERKRLVTQNTRAQSINSDQHNALERTGEQQERRTRKPLNLNAEIASLQAQLANQRQVYAKRPKVHTINAASSRKDIAAYYLDAWRRKVERFGNINYPEEARRQKLFGQLRLEVLIQANGQLKHVQINESSGHPVLDEAALRIVKLAAPYAPFTGELARKYDELRIIRTWRFERGNYLSGG